MREPDALDSARVLALTLIFYAGAWGLAAAGGGFPQLVLGAVFQAVFLAVPLAYAKAAGLKPLRDSGFAPIGLRTAGLVLAASLGSMWLLKEVNDLGVRLLWDLGLDAPGEARRLTEQVKGVTGRGGLVAVLVLVAAPAVCEEVFFRGLVFRGLARTLGWGWALALTTLFFAALHGPLVQKLMMVFVGLYFGLVVWLAGSLWAGVIAHAANNIAVLCVTSLYGDLMGELEPPAWMLALSACVFVMALGLLALDRHRRPVA